MRIEDTDLERSDKKFEKDVIESLRWLGLEWNEGPECVAAEGQLLCNEYRGEFGPYRQSERLDVYEKYLKQLLNQGFAYYCYCSKEDLEAERQAMLAQGLAPKYSGHCRTNPPANKEPQLIRFKLPDRRVSFKDLIRGEISFDTGIMGDIAIAKSLRAPLYNFAVVVDDHEMQISHVIRGEDHINNTPKQILFMEALGFSRPVYAHLPLILDPDRSKMSKRYSATAITDYRNQGYFSEAIINFMALLGWHTKENREVFSLEELVREFDISRVQKAGAVFNTDKLNWLNAHCLKKTDDEELAARLNWESSKKNLKIIKISKERANNLSQIASLSSFFFQLPDYEPSLLVWKDHSREETIKSLNLVKDLVGKNKIKKIPAIAEECGRGEIYWPLRVSLSGSKESPGPMEILDILDREEAEKRIDLAISKLSA